MSNISTISVTLKLDDGSSILLDNIGSNALDSLALSHLTSTIIDSTTARVAADLTVGEHLTTKHLVANESLKVKNTTLRFDGPSETISFPLIGPETGDMLYVERNDTGVNQLSWRQNNMTHEVFVEHFWINYPWWNKLNSDKIIFADSTNLPINLTANDKYLGLAELAQGAYFKIPTIDFSTSLNNINPLIITFRVKPKYLHKLVASKTDPKQIGDITVESTNEGTLKKFVLTGESDAAAVWKEITPTQINGVTGITTGKAFFGIFGVAGFTFDVFGGYDAEMRDVNTGRVVAPNLSDTMPYLTVSVTGSNTKFKFPNEFLNLNLVIADNTIIAKINDIIVSRIEIGLNSIEQNLIGNINVGSTSLREIGARTDSLNFYIDLVKVTEICHFDDRKQGENFVSVNNVG